MATTTPNYGWDVPTSTDYVKDGATAIETLGDDIDASLFSITGGKNVGLVHLNTTTFTSVSSVSFNNIFTSSYKNYRVIVNYNPTSDGSRNVTMRMRASGSDYSTTNYRYAFDAYYFSGGSSPSQLYYAGAVEAEFLLGYGTYTANQTHVATFDLFEPQTTKYPVIHGLLNSNNNTNLYGGKIMGQLLNGTQFDGFSLLASTGSITGSIQVYGYRNS